MDDAGEGVAGGIRMDRDIFPIILLWSRNADSTAVVWSFCWVSLCGSQIVSWSIHEYFAGHCWGLNVGVVGPFHLA